MIAWLVVLFSLGIAFYAMRQIGGSSFSREGSAWKQAAEKAKKKRRKEENDSKE